MLLSHVYLQSNDDKLKRWFERELFSRLDEPDIEYFLYSEAPYDSDLVPDEVTEFKD